MSPASHHHHTHSHHHHHSHVPHNFLRWAPLIVLVFAGIEFIGGIYADSLALISDAGHMFSDFVALAIASFATWVSKQPANQRHSYGFVRAETIAALLNGILMLVLLIWIFIEAIKRLINPEPVAALNVILIAAIGLIINLLLVWMIGRDEETLNLRAALLHVIADLLGSVAALTAGVIIYFTGWMPIDSILSMVIGILILYSTVVLLREAVHVLMEAVPHNLEIDLVAGELIKIPGVSAVHDLHVWTISSGQFALSAHLELTDLSVWPHVLERTKIMLRDNFAIGHVTLQPELAEGIRQPYETKIRILPK